MKSPSPFIQARRELLEKIATRVAPWGYKARISDQVFVRKNELGWRLLHLTSAYGAGSEYWAANIHVALRVDAVEELTKVGIEMPARDRNRSATIGGEIGNIADGRWRPWHIYPRDDLDRVADEMVCAFVSFGLPYLERVSNLETLLDILSNEGAGAVGEQLMPEITCPRAVALALVLGQNERAAAIAMRCGRNFRRHRPGNAHLFSMLEERGFEIPP